MSRGSETSAPIGVVGAGAWGTALAQSLARAGQQVLIWALEEEVAGSINEERANRLYGPDVTLDERITATNALAELADCSPILLVTPAQHLRGTVERLPDTRAPLVLCAKGIEAETGALMTDVAREVRPASEIAVLSGPTFAHEVAAGLPAAVTLACQSRALWERIAPRIASPHFRPYYSDDLIGAEIGGAIKNVLAIGCGVVDGAGLGQNARAALISRGFAEMRRFGLAKGARAETLGGLSGLGDLVLTCSSTSSRNYSLGRGLGEGRPAAELLADRRTVAEGAFTAPVLKLEARKLGVDMPIADAVCNLLSGEEEVGSLVDALMTRPLQSETDREGTG